MEGMIGEIRLFASNFAPRTWAFCEGQLLPISQNTALFSILGTTYGGDGRTTFALPDLRGRVSIQPGNGPGLPSYRLGQKGGVQDNTLTVATMPAHSHTGVGTTKANNANADNPNPTSNSPAVSNGRGSGGAIAVNSYSNTSNANMADGGVKVTITNTGGNLPVNNLEPYLAVPYIICLQGVFPSRS